MFQSLVILLLALFIDRLIGDPKTHYHPVALIGRFIGWWGRPELYKGCYQRTIGIIGWISTVVLFSSPFIIVQFSDLPYLYLIAGPFLLKFCFAWRSLEEHANNVTKALSLDLRKKQASLLVSRDTSELSDEQVLSAAYESVSENLNDSIIAPLFWFLILGLSGSAIYRAVNTMDAMLGYKDERRYIGWFAARMDDIFSWIPARICGVLLIIRYAMNGRLKQSVRVFRQDRRKRPGFNGGIPMSLIAGGEGICFEKPGVYVMGIPEIPLLEAGPAIIRTIRIVILLFFLVAGFALILLDLMNNIYRI